MIRTVWRSQGRTGRLRRSRRLYHAPPAEDQFTLPPAVREPARSAWISWHDSSAECAFRICAPIEEFGAVVVFRRRRSRECRRRWDRPGASLSLL